MPNLQTLKDALELLNSIKAMEIDGTERRHMANTGGKLYQAPCFEEIGDVLIHFAHLFELPAGTDLPKLIAHLEQEIAGYFPGTEARLQTMEAGQ